MFKRLKTSYTLSLEQFKRIQGCQLKTSQEKKHMRLKTVKDYFLFSACVCLSCIRKPRERTDVRTTYNLYCNISPMQF